MAPIRKATGNPQRGVVRAPDGTRHLWPPRTRDERLAAWRAGLGRIPTSRTHRDRGQR